MLNNKSVLIGLLSLLVASASPATTISTGDLGQNVIPAAGAYVWSPTVTSLTNGLPASLSVAHALWNDPGLEVHASVNGVEVGIAIVVTPYSDGLVTTTFHFTNLLVDGVNTIRLDGLGVHEGEYVIGSIELNYNLPLPPVIVTNPPPPPPPGTNEPVSGPFVRNGTSVLHYQSRAPVMGAAPESTVSGSTSLQFNEQGGASLQKLDFTASGLAPSTTYNLIAVLGADPNAQSITAVTTDSRGRVRLSFMQKGDEQGTGNKALPAALNPVTHIRGLGLAETVNSQTVAFALVSEASSIQYLVKRNLTPADTNATPAGSISLKANASTVNFRLLAGGLNPGATYSLALNGTVLASTTANSEGLLKFSAWPANAPAVLEVHTLALVDGSDNVVLSTLLPK